MEALVQFVRRDEVLSVRAGRPPPIRMLTDAEIELPSESVAVRVTLWVPGFKLTERGEPVPSAP
jgi:hypothetical protein